MCRESAPDQTIESMTSMRASPMSDYLSCHTTAVTYFWPNTYNNHHRYVSRPALFPKVLHQLTILVTLLYFVFMVNGQLEITSTPSHRIVTTESSPVMTNLKSTIIIKTSTTISSRRGKAATEVDGALGKTISLLGQSNQFPNRERGSFKRIDDSAEKHRGQIGGSGGEKLRHRTLVIVPNHERLTDIQKEFDEFLAIFEITLNAEVSVSFMLSEGESISVNCIFWYSNGHFHSQD